LFEVSSSGVSVRLCHFDNGPFSAEFSPTLTAFEASKVPTTHSASTLMEVVFEIVLCTTWVGLAIVKIKVELLNFTGV
jgi:hypothetical protein